MCLQDQDLLYLINNEDKYSLLAADTKLHSLTQGHMTYAQLQAQVQKFVKLATRMEPEETRAQLVKVKENTIYLIRR